MIPSRILVAAALSAALSAGVGAQSRASSKDTLSNTLINLEQRSWKAWKDRDSTFYRGFLSDDHVEVGVGGPAGKGDVVETVGSPSCVVASYSTDRFTVTKLSETAALVVYHAAQQTTCGGKPVPSPVWVSSLYVWRAGRWVNAAYQQTPATR